MARAFYRYEKIDDIISATDPLFDHQARQVIFASTGGGYSIEGEANIARYVEDAIFYFIRIQSDPKTNDSYSDLIDETLGIGRFTIIENLAEESKARVEGFVERTWHLMAQYARMKSGEVHQIWMETQVKKEQAREETAIAEIRKTYAVYNLQSWTSMDAWTNVEAAALSIRIEPRFALDLPSNYDEATKIYFTKALESRIEMIKRAVSAGIFRDDAIAPKIFELWSKSKGWTFDDPASEIDTDTLHTNTKHKLYSIILSMAFQNYKIYPIYDKMYKAFGDVSAIARDCEICGLPVSAKTIQKHLDLALDWAKENNLDKLKTIAARNAS